ncbi:MAG: EscR/YscR/HrcR family type III secretion system export apparatus protein [Deltaproteobacteria bacterium]|nr:MAG: EscR/YscR/HrcR family type III secretion system export apparatus protein [Deltaproteobacteria bacterium]
MNLSPTTYLLFILGAGLLPFVLVVLTSFVKMAVVLSVARTAMGTPQLPPNSVITGLAIVLSMVVMAPVAGQVSERLRQRQEVFRAADVSSMGTAIAEAAQPLRRFLLQHAHPEQLQAVAEAIGTDTNTEPGWPVLVTAFVISQLHEAFQIGFYIFLPFLVLDMLVASVLLSLGMHMLSPTTVSLPLKLLLFVFADGWTLLGTNLLGSYH